MTDKKPRNNVCEHKMKIYDFYCSISEKNTLPLGNTFEELWERNFYTPRDATRKDASSISTKPKKEASILVPSAMTASLPATKERHNAPTSPTSRKRKRDATVKLSSSTFSDKKPSPY